LNLRPPRPERGRYVILDASTMRNPWSACRRVARFGADLPRPSTKPLDVLVVMWLCGGMTNHDPFTDPPEFIREKKRLRRVAEFYRPTPAEKEAARQADPRLSFGGQRWTMPVRIVR
jgi:hypothetical protein